MRKAQLIGSEIGIGEFGSFLTSITHFASLKKSSYTCIANVHMLVEAYFDKSFAKVVNEADIVTPDGKPLCWALYLLYNVRQERVAGMDLLPNLLKRAEEEGISVYFYGGTNETLIKTERFVQTHFPVLQVAGMYSPPFRPLNPIEENDIINKINSSGAGMVFVILGCPKQEKWMAAMKGRINAMMIGIGGAVPVVIGMQRRAPYWMQKFGMEWLFRLVQEPKRLFKRYAITNSVFLFLIIREIIKLRILKRLLPQS